MAQAATGVPPLDAPYWEALKDGKLVIQCCQTCSTWLWPPKARCAECGTWDPQWVQTQMEGKLYSWAKSWYAFAGAEGLEKPYVTVLVELPAAGRRRLMGLFEGDEGVLKLGAPLVGRRDWTQLSDHQAACIRWRPA